MSNMYFDPALYPDSTVILSSLNGTFAVKRVAVPEGQGIYLGRLMDPNDVPTVPRFNSKVVSRQHAIISQPTAGRWQIKDAGSSSGTFLQNQRFGDQPYRLSEQGKESTLFELHDGDIIQLGEDYVANGATHKCIKMSITLPQPASTPPSTSFSNQYEFDPDGSFVDYANDPDVKRDVEQEFHMIWTSLTTPLVFGKLNRAVSASSFGSNNSPSAMQAGWNSTLSSGTLSSGGQQRKPSTPDASANISPADKALQVECIAFIKQLQWDTPDLRDRLIIMVDSGDGKILGFYRSLKQFPSAFKDVVTKHATNK